MASCLYYVRETVVITDYLKHNNSHDFTLSYYRYKKLKKQFLREQNELEINKAKELSNIEVTYNNKIHVLIIITCRYLSLV